MKTLPPMALKDKYYAAIQREIQRIFDLAIYDPLVRIIKGKLPMEMQNSSESLRSAIAKGSVWYEEGEFRGSFNSTISKQLRAIGAIFNPGSDTWSLPLSHMPADISSALALANMKYGAMRQSMIRALSDINVDETVKQASRIREEYRKTVNELENDWRSAAGAIVIETKLTDEQRDIIADEWANNLDLYIRGWMEQNILNLRQKLQPHILAGSRAESLVRTIRENYGVSQSKAKFLARQETSLLMSKFQETRYRDSGVTTYRWSTSHDERVRPDHEKLNGKVFQFSDPPITNRKTGARNNPGEDFNCRCVAIPIVK